MPSSQPTSVPTRDTASAARLLITPPEITKLALAGMPVASNRTQVAVTASLSVALGTVYCGAFTTPVTAVAQIVDQGFRAVVTTTTATVLLSGLLPRTSYTLQCTTMSAQGGNYLSLASSLKFSVPATTACCKIATVTMPALSIFVKAPATTGILIALEMKPTVNITAKLSFASSASSALTVPALYPSEVTFTKLSTALSSAVTIVGAMAGNFTLSVELVGASAGEYSLVFGSKRILQILSADAEPPTPALTTGRFSADGSYIELLFNAATNNGGYASGFLCSALLSFVSEATATCQFSSSTSIKIFSNALIVGSEVTLKADFIRAFCGSGDTAVCGKWASIGETVVILSAPDTLLLPTVLISSPTSLGACQSLTLDLTSSTGNAGRPWSSYAVSAQRAGVSGGDGSLNSFLQTSYKLSPPTKIAADLLIKGATYLFTAKLCNFLNACGTTTQAVVVTTDESVTPVVTISGGNERTINTYSTLAIKAIAFTQSCTGAVSSSNLTYNWTASSTSTATSNAALASLRSTSQNPAIYKLPAYSLPRGTYTLTVVAYSSLYKSSSSTAATVTVSAGNIMAVIAGGKRASCVLSLRFLTLYSQVAIVPSVRM